MILALIPLVVLGCTIAPKPISDTGKPFKGPGYSLTPPPGREWFLMMNSRDYLAIGTKPGPHNATTGITVEVERLDDPVADKDGFVSTLRFLHGLTFGSRFETIHKEYRPIKSVDGICVDFTISVYDHKAKTADGTKKMIMEMFGKTCVMDSAPTRMVEAVFSNRHLEGMRPPGLDDEALRSLSYVSFE